MQGAPDHGFPLHPRLPLRCVMRLPCMHWGDASGFRDNISGSQRGLHVPAGHDEINLHGVKEHESYRGDRTQASLVSFADNLVPSAGQPHHYIRCADALGAEQPLPPFQQEDGMHALLMARGQLRQDWKAVAL